MLIISSVSQNLDYINTLSSSITKSMGWVGDMVLSARFTFLKFLLQ